MKQLILTIILMCVVGCAQAVEGEPENNWLPKDLTTFQLYGFTEQEQGIIKNALEEFDENLTIGQGGSNIVAADIHSSGLTYTTDTYSSISINQNYRTMDDWLTSRLRKIVLHEVGHHIVNFRCGHKYSGHIGPGNIMSASPELQSENLTEQDFAYINCEIDPATMTPGSVSSR